MEPKMHVLIYSILLLLAFAEAHPLSDRNLISNAAGQSYDYIVVGCGVSGLVVAARLSEDQNGTVLCLEAGDLDHQEDFITIPYYIGLQPGGFYEWGLSTVSQPQLDGKARRIPMGKGVGGGSLINGMVWNRGNQESYNSWNAVGNEGWSWQDLLPYFKKSETYTPKTYEGHAVQPFMSNSSIHGFGGPVQVSYPNYYWPQTDNWFAALQELGIPTSAEPNDGLDAGGYFLPLNIDPVNQTRLDARRAYFNPNIGRDNLDIQTNSVVTRILFNTANGIEATGVEFADGPDAPRQTAYASREVVLAAGALHSPQLLELSGIGQASVLNKAGITPLQNLPGVGNNLQDHGLIHLDYPYTNPNISDIRDFATNATFNNQSKAEYFASRTGPWTAKPSCAVAFPSLLQMIGNETTAMLLSSARSAPRFLPDTYTNEDTLINGFEHQLNSILTELSSPNTPALENLNNNAGGLDLANMRPLSRGTTHITTADPFTPPSIDPRWLVHPFDLETMVLGMQLNQRLLDTTALQALGPSYVDVPRNANRDSIISILKAGVGTEFHYSGTTAMMPLELGGVVDSNLRVYGTANLRVVDTGIFPMVPGAHLQAVAYAVAEKAADLIRGRMSA